MKNFTTSNKITLTARIWPEEGGFVSECVEYGVASQGDTEDEALEMLIEAVELYLDESGTDEL
jgi:predicted RNase H-like HicB family nuclease